MTAYGTLQNDKSQRAALKALLNGTNELPAGSLGPGSVERGVVEELRDLGVPVTRFGTMDPDGTADSSIALRAACQSGERSILIPAGTYLANEIKTPDDLVIQGSGMDATVIQYQANTRCFYNKDLGTRGTLILRDLTIEGPWTPELSQGDYDDEAVVLGGYQRVIIERVRVHKSRYFGIRVSDADFVIVRDCLVEETCKDGIHILRCTNVLVEGCTVRHVGDDAIVALSEQSATRKSGSWRFIGNQVEDANGIKMLGANRGIIAGNTTARTRCYSCHVGGSDLTYGPNDPVDIQIVDNVFQDNLNKGYVVEGQDLDVGIFVAAPNPVIVPSSTAPGTFDHATNAWVKPDGYFGDSYVDGNPVGGMFRLRIANNIVTKTLPAGAAYSAWDFGTMFKADGYVDPTISSHVYQTGTALRLYGGCHYDLDIHNNRFEGWKDGILWQTGNAWAGKRWRIKDNVFRRIKTNGFAISSGTPFSSDLLAASVDIAFLDNVFDMDPYLEHSLRASDGRWTNTSETEPAALAIQYLRGVYIDGNRFRNLWQSLVLTGGTTSTFYEWGPRNLYVGTFDGKGVGNIRNGASSLFRIEDSDPTSNEYGLILSAQTAMESTAVPSSGYFHIGQRVRNSAAAQSAAVGWVCTGTASSAWASGVAPGAGSLRTNAGTLYRLITAGGGNTANAPTHTYGEATGADGYTWRAQINAGYISGGTWASGQSYSAGTVRSGAVANLSRVYLLVTAGGGTTANEPTHTAGTATGADGYVWRFLADLAVSVRLEAAIQ